MRKYLITIITGQGLETHKVLQADRMDWSKKNYILYQSTGGVASRDIPIAWYPIKYTIINLVEE